jgi:hypothetical protein
VNTPDYAEVAARFGIDLVAIFLCVYALYYARHRRRDLVTAFTMFNVGLFAVVAVITVRPIGAAVGFGLFALLSIIRLRSEPFSNIEIGYFFAALVLGLVNGLTAVPFEFAGALDSAILLTLFVVDHPKLWVLYPRSSARTWCSTRSIVTRSRCAPIWSGASGWPSIR